MNVAFFLDAARTAHVRILVDHTAVHVTKGLRPQQIQTFVKVSS